nr:MAG TPA: hypothetical protein [Caudoviricetes sp.]
MHVFHASHKKNQCVSKKRSNRSNMAGNARKIKEFRVTPKKMRKE